MNNQFLIIDEHVNREEVIAQGNRFLIGNLKLGFRGTLDEYTKTEMVGLNLPFIYDKHGDAWREPVNAPNPLFFQIIVDGKSLNALDGYVKHKQTLDISCGLFSRETVFEINDNAITFISKRFVSEVDSRRILATYEITTKKPTNIFIITGIDGDVWEINGPHFNPYKISKIENHLKLQTTTIEKGREIVVHESTIGNFNYDEQVIADELHVYRHITFKSQANKTYIMKKCARIAVDESDNDHLFKESMIENFETQLDNHKKIWYKKWDVADVVLTGDDQANQALRYSIYHLLMLSPSNFPATSIPARGISGQTYKGAIFWDTEIFLLPFFLNVDIQAAKSIVEYRIKTLRGALEKAQSYGYQGAFYPWESQENGIEACTDYNVTDVFTGRKVRTYFRDKQIHISADVVYGLWLYYERTKDEMILLNGGADVILACARFYQDRSYWNINKKRAEYLDVLGPDEYHERVHNNAFTNKMIRFVFQILEETDAILKQHHAIYHKKWIAVYKDELSVAALIEFGKTIYLKEIMDNGLIEQFDGYMKLNDKPLDALLSERLNPNEYLGGFGLAGDTKIIKQADVITMLYLFRSEYDREIMEANFNFYEPRTEHGSSLSVSMYALVASMIGKSEYAYKLFLKSATIDLMGKSKQYAGGIYIGGTHPAAAGGAYLTAINGFAGLTVSPNGEIECHPNLPLKIQSMFFSIVIDSTLYRISITGKHVTIKKEKLT